MACETLGMNSGQWTVVRPVAVWGCVWARSVREDATWSDYDRPSLLFLAGANLPLGALNVLDCLEKGDGRYVMSVPIVPSSVRTWKPFRPQKVQKPVYLSYLNDGVQVLSRRGRCIDNWCWAHGYHGDMMRLGRLDRSRDDDCGMVCRYRGGGWGQHLLERSTYYALCSCLHYTVVSDRNGKIVL